MKLRGGRGVRVRRSVDGFVVELADAGAGAVGPAGPAGADGADGADGVDGADGADGRVDPEVVLDVYDDFVRGVGGVTAFTFGGAGAAVAAAAGEAAAPGIASANTGTSGAGYAGGWLVSPDAIVFGTGEWRAKLRVRLANLSTAAQRYAVQLGFFDTETANLQGDAAFLLYDESTSANWQMSTAQGATRTTTASGTAVAAATWLRVEVVVNAAASSAEFFVDGVSLGTVATNIPSGTQKTGVGFRIHKSAGATARTLEVDYLHARCEFTSAR